MWAYYAHKGKQNFKYQIEQLVSGLIFLPEASEIMLTTAKRCTVISFFYLPLKIDELHLDLNLQISYVIF